VATLTNHDSTDRRPIMDELGELFTHPDVVLDVDDTRTETLLGDGHVQTGGMQATAVFSADRRHRYLLTRIWNEHSPPLVWLLLNPATADAFTLDPTVTRCLRRTRTAGYGGLVVLNLFAFRAGDPADMRRAKDPVGPLNDRWIEVYARVWGRLVCGWGDGHYLGRAAKVLNRLAELEVALVCLDRNADGQPRHPLYIPYSQDFQAYEPEAR
jgi:hypothetical protein